MDVSAATAWWVVAGLAVAAELASGTFYLLIFALGCAAGAIAAHLGLPTTVQVVAAALVAGVGTAAWHWKRARHPRSAPAASNRDVNLDVGEFVQVGAWNADRTARVQYRGAQWTARLQPGAEPRSGQHRVAAVEGNWLVLEPASTP